MKDKEIQEKIITRLSNINDKYCPHKYKLLSINPNLTLQFIEKHINKPWFWGAPGLSSNINFNLDWIHTFPDKDWDWKLISRIGFIKERERFILDKHRQYIKDNLKEELMMVAYHPLNIEKYLSMGYEIEELDENM